MSRTQLDRPFLCRLLFAVALASAVVQILHGVQVRREAAALRAEAERAEAEGDGKRCAHYLGLALVLTPDDNQALRDYAEVLDRQAAVGADRSHVLALYRQLLARDPALADVRRRVAALEVEQGHLDEAALQLRLLLERTPADPELHGLLGQCCERQGSYQDAARAYEAAIAHAPAAPDGYVRLAHLLGECLGEPKRADAVMDGMVAANPGSAAAYLARGRYRAGRGRLKEAAGDLARAADLAPGDAEVLAAQGELAQRRGRLDEARDIWRRDLQAHPDDPRAYLGLAAVARQAGRLGETADVLRRGTEVLPGRADLLAALAEALMDKGDEAAATEVISGLHGDAAAEDAAGYLDGLLLLRQGRWEEAARCFQAVGASPRADADLAARAELARAHCYDEMGQPDRRLEACRRAVGLTPNSSPALYGLASALMAQGDSAAAVEPLRRLAERPDAPEGTWTLLARASLEINRRLPPGGRDWQEVERAIDRAAALASQAAEAGVLRAEVLTAKGHPESAAIVLEDTREDYPRSPAPWIALAETALRQGDGRAAVRLLREADGRLNDSAAWRLAAIGLWDRHGGPEAVSALVELGRDLEQFSTADQLRLLHALAEANYRVGNLAEAGRLTARLLERRPSDVRGRLLQTDLALRTGGDADVARAVADLRDAEGDEGAGWRWAEAAGLVRSAGRGAKADLAKARRLLGEAARFRPGWPRLALLEARVDELEGRTDLALEAYLWALKLGESRPEVAARAVQLLAQRGRYAEADRVVRRLEERVRLGPAQARLAAEIAVRAGNPSRALDLARQAVPADATDYREHLWLGSLLASLGRYGEAEEVFRRAVRVAGPTPDARVALVAYLAQAGEPAEAEAALRETAKALPPEEAPLAVAQGYEALARFDRARQEYARAAARRPHHFLTLARAAQFHLRLAETEQAEPLLRRLLGPDVDAPEEAAAWARRELALALAAGDPARCAEARALLDRNAAGGESATDRRARAFVAAAAVADPRQAARALEASLAVETLTPGEQFQLARTYEKAKDRAHAEPILRRLVVADGHNPAYLAEYAAVLLRQGKAPEARRWLTRLEEVEPDSPRTRDLRRQLDSAPSRQGAARK